jgi:hypothetical protein
MRALLMTIAFVVLATMCSCTKSQDLDSTTAQNAVAKITYVKDSRTNFCFATVGNRSYGTYVIVSIAHVPCDSIPPNLLH